ncbi:hypothetical protein DFH09DRAFT_1089135 [Mycena vulgaris]|nr:hypothetical protein DFH09DRAFT_1089135 [Mycena vulgaris]
MPSVKYAAKNADACAEAIFIYAKTWWRCALPPMMIVECKTPVRFGIRTYAEERTKHKPQPFLYDNADPITCGYAPAVHSILSITQSTRLTWDRVLREDQSLNIKFEFKSRLSSPRSSAGRRPRIQSQAFSIHAASLRYSHRPDSYTRSTRGRILRRHVDFYVCTVAAGAASLLLFLPTHCIVLRSHSNQQVWSGKQRRHGVEVTHRKPRAVHGCNTRSSGGGSRILGLACFGYHMTRPERGGQPPAEIFRPLSLTVEYCRVANMASFQLVPAGIRSTRGRAVKPSAGLPPMHYCAVNFPAYAEHPFDSGSDHTAEFVQFLSGVG